MIMFPILRRLVNLLGVRSIKKVPVITPSPWEARVGYKPVSFRKKWQAGSQEAGGVLSTFPQEAAHRSGMHKVLGAEPRLFLESCLPFPKEHLGLFQSLISALCPAQVPWRSQRATPRRSTPGLCQVGKR